MGRYFRTRRGDASQSKKKAPLAVTFDLNNPTPWLSAIYKEHGVVFAYISKGETTYHFHGFSNPTAEDKIPVDKQTRFEIGSITKPIVGLVLSAIVQEKSIALNTALADFFPDLTSAAKDISLIELATHRSGLSRLPENLSLAEMDNPYKGYSSMMLFDALQSADPKTKDFEYSNFGFGVLGTALEVTSNKPLNELLQQRVFLPAKMQDTFLSLDDVTIEGVADGHDILFEKVSHWTFDAIAGAGAGVSTAKDMLALGNYLLENKDAPHVSLFLTPHTAQAPKFGIGIMLNDEIAFHGGQTGGFGSFFAVDFENEHVVVVLTNVSKDAGKLGFNILNAINE